jgi:hypothetical protein
MQKAKKGGTPESDFLYLWYPTKDNVAQSNVII